MIKEFVLDYVEVTKTNLEFFGEHYIGVFATALIITGVTLAIAERKTLITKIKSLFSK